VKERGPSVARSEEGFLSYPKKDEGGKGVVLMHSPIKKSQQAEKGRWGGRFRTKKKGPFLKRGEGTVVEEEKTPSRTLLALFRKRRDKRTFS